MLFRSVPDNLHVGVYSPSALRYEVCVWGRFKNRSLKLNVEYSQYNISEIRHKMYSRYKWLRKRCTPGLVLEGDWKEWVEPSPHLKPILANAELWEKVQVNNDCTGRCNFGRRALVVQPPTALPTHAGVCSDCCFVICRPLETVFRPDRGTIDRSAERGRLSKFTVLMQFSISGVMGRVYTALNELWRAGIQFCDRSRRHRGRFIDAAP